jgi:hypothetical protein
MRGIVCCPPSRTETDAVTMGATRVVGGGGTRARMMSSEDARDDGADGDGDGADARDDDARRNVAKTLSALKRRRERQGTRRASERVDAMDGGASVRAPTRARDDGAALTTFATHEDLSPLDDPQGTLRGVLSVFADESSGCDWERRCEAISLANRLVCHHPQIVVSQLRPFVVGVATCLDSLRSAVSRAALSLVKSMTIHLKGQLDGEIECVLPSVMKRAIEVSFLSAEAVEVIHRLVESTEPRRMIKALSHHVHERRFRTKVALALTYCVERNAEVSNAFRGVAGRAAIATAYAILNDCVQCGGEEARTFTRRCLTSIFRVSTHEERDKAMRHFPDLREFSCDAD